MDGKADVVAPLVLIGAPGAGKTRLGKRVAHLLALPFIDTDKTIVAEHGPISAIFQEHGEAYFRLLERAAVVDALHTAAVVALGGGAVLDPETQADLSGARVAQLTVSAEAVRGRITGNKRPLLKGGLDDWMRLVDSRKPIYDSLAAHTWDTSLKPLDDIAAEVADWVRHDSVTPSAVQKEPTQ